MIHRDCPTIAESSDVITTVLDGVDGIILDEETSRGKYINIGHYTCLVINK